MHSRNVQHIQYEFLVEPKLHYVLLSSDVHAIVGTNKSGEFKKLCDKHKKLFQFPLPSFSSEILPLLIPYFPYTFAFSHNSLTFPILTQIKDL